MNFEEIIKIVAGIFLLLLGWFLQRLIVKKKVYQPIATYSMLFFGALLLSIPEVAIQLEIITSIQHISIVIQLALFWGGFFILLMSGIGTSIDENLRRKQSNLIFVSGVFLVCIVVFALLGLQGIDTYKLENGPGYLQDNNEITIATLLLVIYSEYVVVLVFWWSIKALRAEKKLRDRVRRLMLTTSNFVGIIMIFSGGIGTILIYSRGVSDPNIQRLLEWNGYLIILASIFWTLFYLPMNRLMRRLDSYEKRIKQQSYIPLTEIVDYMKEHGDSYTTIATSDIDILLRSAEITIFDLVDEMREIPNQKKIHDLIKLAERVTPVHERYYYLEKIANRLPLVES